MKDFFLGSFVGSLRTAVLAVAVLGAPVAAYAQPLTSNVGPNIGTQSIGEASFGLLASGGGGGPYTWSVVGGTLPTGLSLRTDLPSYLTGFQAALWGVATVPGTYSFTLRASNSSTTADFPTQMKITAFRVIDNYDLPHANAGQASSYQFTAAGAAGPVTFTNLSSPPLPAGITLSNSGLLSIGVGAPAGFYVTQFSASDGVDTIFRSAALTVAPLKFSSLILQPNATQNQAYAASIGVTGGTAPYTVIHFGGLPAGLVMDTSGGISGTVQSGPGRYLFTVQATDSSVPAKTYTRTLTLYVVGAPEKLASITPYGTAFSDCTLGVPCLQGVHVELGGTGPFAWSATGLPAGLTMSSTTIAWMNPGDGMLTGVATVAGQYSVTVTATDVNGATVSNTYPLKVSKLADRHDTSVIPALGVPFSLPLRTIGGVAPYSATLIGGRLPQGTSINAATHRIEGTPLESGTFSPTLLITDALGETLRSQFVFNVSSSGPGIQHTGDLGTYTVGSSFSQQLFACCPSSPLVWSHIGGAMPPGMSLSSGGMLSAVALNTPGLYTFLVQVQSGPNTTAMQFMIRVTPLSSSLPFDLGFANVGTPFSRALTVTGAVGSYSWTIEPGSFAPPGLQAALSGGTWFLQGTPTATGQFIFGLRVTDSAGNVLTRFVSLSVYPNGGSPPVGISESGNLGTWMLGEINQQLTPTGGNGTYTWSVVSGALPPGVALRVSPYIPSFFSPSSRAGFIGIATTPGNYAFRLRVQSGTSSFERDYTMKVASLMVDDQFTLPDAFVGFPYSHQLSASGANGPVTWTATAPLPPGVTLSSGGLLSSVSGLDDGFYSISMSVSDGTDTILRAVNFNVFNVRITSASELGNVLVGTGTTFALTAALDGSPCGSPTCAFSASGLPSGTLLGTNGTLTVPSTLAAGRYSFNVTATGPSNVSFSRRVVFVVVPSPMVLPSITSSLLSVTDCTFAVACSRIINVNNGGGGPYTWVASGLPAGLTLRFGSTVTGRFITPGDAEIAGVPRQIGLFNITLTVTDAVGGKASQTFPLRISALGSRDFFTAADRGVPYTSRIRIIGGNPGSAGTGGYTSTIISGSLPAGLTLDAATQTITGTPLENGSFSFTLSVVDSALPTPNPLVISHGLQVGAGTSTIAISSSDLGTALIGQSVNTSLFACCAPGGFTWTLESGALPSNLILNSATGQITGTVASSNTPGVLTFRFRAADAQNANNFGIRDVTLRLSTLQVTNATSTLPDGEQGVAYPQQTLTASGANGQLTWTLSPNNLLPAGLTLSSAGVIGGTPSGSGTFTFAVNVTDPAGSLATRTFTVSIYPTGTHRPLSMVSIGNLSVQRGTFTRGFSTTDVSGGVGPYTMSLVSVTPFNPGLRMLSAPPYPTAFTPATTLGVLAGVIGTPGDYVATVRVTDGASATFDRAVNIKVLSVGHRSSSALPYARTTEPYTFQLEPLGTGPFTWTGTSLPGGISLNATTGVLSGTPTTAGTFNFTVTLTDQATQQSVGQTYTLLVNAFQILTPGALPNATVGVQYTQAISAPGCQNPCAWALTGALPGGLTLNTSTGVVSGLPNGSFVGGFTIRATGSNGQSAARQFSIIVNNPPFPVLTITTGLSDVTVGSNVSQQLSASGGAPPYTFTLLSGALPTGITLGQPGENFSSSFGTGLAYLRGKAIEVGIYNFTLQVTDDQGQTATRAYSWNISPLAFSYTSLPVSTGPTLVLNTAYSQPLLVLGGTDSYPSWTLVAPLPGGLSLNTSTGVVSGTPTETGSLTARVQVVDTVGNAFASNVTVTVGTGATSQVSFGSGNLGSIMPGAQAAFNVGASAPQSAGAITYTAVTPLPPGFALSVGTDPVVGGSTTTTQLIGIATSPGTYSFTLRADSVSGGFAVRTFTFLVTAFSTPGGTLLNLPDTWTGNAGYSQQLMAFPLTGTATWTVAPGSRLPNGLSLSSNGLLTGTPTQVGAVSFAADITDGSGTTFRRTFTLNVSSVQLTDNAVLPVATVGLPYNYTFNPGPSAFFTASGLPAGLSLSSTTGEITGIPTTRGTFVVTVTAGDASPLTITRRFTIFVRTPIQPVLDIPAQLADIGYFTVGQPVTFGLSVNSGAPPYTWSVAPGSTLPPGWSLQTSAVVHTLTPGTAALAGAPTTVGTFTFTIRVTDAAGTIVDRQYTARMTPLSILGGNPANGTTGTPYSARFAAVGGGAMSFSASPNDTTTTGNPLPPGLTLAANGTLSGTPTSTGSYTFFLTATDGTNSFRKSVTILVNSPSNLRVTNTAFFHRNVGGGFANRLTTTAPATTNFTWTLVSGSLPPGAAFATGISPAQFPNSTWIAGRGTVAGEYTFTVRATEDGNPGNTADHQFTYVIPPMQFVQPAPDLFGGGELLSGRVGQPYSYTLKVAGGTGPYTFAESSLRPLPAGLTLSSSGVLSGTPAAHAIGNFLLTPIVTDAQGKTAIADGLTVTIAPAGTAAPLLRGNANPAPASVGVPYNAPLDPLLRGGTAPLTWTVAAGHTLPPGLAIVNGSSGVWGFLTGTPTMAQTTPYTFTLEVSDSSSPVQTLQVPLTVQVFSITLSPDALPNGTVGTPYSQALTASGGAPPYTMQLVAGSSLPPGVTFAGGGLLSGTPTQPGNFVMQVAVTDATNTTFGKFYVMTIDNAAGQAPAVSLAPKPITVYYETGAPNPAPISVAVNSTSGALGYGAIVGNVPGASLSASTGTTSSSINLTIDPTGVPVGTYTGLIVVKANGAVNFGDWTPVTLTVAPAPPCTYAVNPQTGSAEATGGSGGFAVSAGNTCAWTATTAASWIHVTGGSSGTGNGNVNFTVDPNLGPSTPSRTGTIDVNGALYTLTQFGTNALNCAFVISPASVAPTAVGGTAIVTVTASNALCAWTATSATMSLSPSGGTGSGSVTVIVPANGDPGSRTLNASIAGHTFSAVQSGIDCVVTLGPYAVTSPAAGVTGSVEVTTPAGCGYSTVLGPSWISVTSGASGTGPGTLVYSVEANSTTVPRTGSLSIGGQTFTVNQAALACSVTVNTATLGSPYGSATSNGSIAIAANGGNCGWTASSSVSWASVSPANANGDGTVNVFLQPNSLTLPRSGSLTVAGQTINITQSGTACTFALETTSGAAPATGGTGSVRVIAPANCTWPTTASNDGWLNIVTAGSTGTSEVQFSAAANPTASPRNGSLTIAGITYSVSQAGAPCSYSITGATTSPMLASGGVGGQTFNFTSTFPGCTPSPLSYASWISIDASSFSGTSGSVTFSVLQNFNGTARTGTIIIGNAVFTVVQAGSPCAFSLNAYGRIFQSAGGSETVRGSANAVGCTPDVGTDQPSFILLEPLTGPELNIWSLPYTVAPFPVSLNSTIRFGRISFGGQIVFIKQYSW